jgi:hypothetical protein
MPFATQQKRRRVSLSDRFYPVLEFDCHSARGPCSDK